MRVCVCVCGYVHNTQQSVVSNQCVCMLRVCGYVCLHVYVYVCVCVCGHVHDPHQSVVSNQCVCMLRVCGHVYLYAYMYVCVCVCGHVHDTQQSVVSNPTTNMTYMHTITIYLPTQQPRADRRRGPIPRLHEFVIFSGPGVQAHGDLTSAVFRPSTYP
jgi:hypothetical protein